MHLSMTTSCHVSFNLSLQLLQLGDHFLSFGVQVGLLVNDKNENETETL